jgi:hypothetical protein
MDKIGESDYCGKRKVDPTKPLCQEIPIVNREGGVRGLEGKHEPAQNKEKENCSVTVNEQIEGGEIQTAYRHSMKMTRPRDQDKLNKSAERLR